MSYSYNPDQPTDFPSLRADTDPDADPSTVSDYAAAATDEPTERTEPAEYGDSPYTSQYPTLGTDPDAQPSTASDYATAATDEPTEYADPTYPPLSQPAEYDVDPSDVVSPADKPEPLSYAAALGDIDENSAPSYGFSGAPAPFADESAELGADGGECAMRVSAALEAVGDDLASAAGQLWELDDNRLTPGEDYSICTERAPRRDDEDEGESPGPFVTEISDSVWERPTFAALRNLLDNYTAETGIPERVEAEERMEEKVFVEAVCSTPCMQFAQQWLASYAASEDDRMMLADMAAFRQAVQELWFGLYARDADRDSCGFEHVFCGELDDGRVKGLHNFTQVVVEEQRGNLTFRGCLGDEVGEESSQVATIRFDWLGYTKRASSMFVGVSPEFEVALYTMWWFANNLDDPVEMGPYTVRVKMYDMDGRLAAAFPEVLDIDYDDLDSTW